MFLFLSNIMMIIPSDPDLLLMFFVNRNPLLLSSHERKMKVKVTQRNPIPIRFHHQKLFLHSLFVLSRIFILIIRLSHHVITGL